MRVRGQDAVRVKVGPRTFHVTLMSPEEPDYGDTLGECFSGHIQLLGTQPPDCMASTLVHELIHAVHFAYGMKGRRDEEEICEALEGPLLALIVDNPKLCSVLRKAVKQGVAINLKETQE